MRNRILIALYTLSYRLTQHLFTRIYPDPEVRMAIHQMAMQRARDEGTCELWPIQEPR